MLTATVQAPIKSKLLGDIKRESLSGDFSIYITQFPTKRHGLLKIVLNGYCDGKLDWPSLGTRVDSVLPVLLQSEPRLRGAAVPCIRRLRSRYFDLEDDDEWRGSAAKLSACLKLTQINFSNSYAVQMRYSGGEPCHGLDVCLELGPRLALRTVAFDG
jgi:hypothetical protein